jgi:hypothetical protein
MNSDRASNFQFSVSVFSGEVQTKSLGVVRLPYTEVSGKKWEIAIQPNPGARTKEMQWLASCYRSSWSPFAKFRIFGETQDGVYKRAVATIEAAS